MRIRILLSILALLASVPQAAAQWQTTNHSIPVGAGAGKTGFRSAGPCLLNVPIVGAGVSADPACYVTALGSLSAQSASSVAITGGSITGLPDPTVSSQAATKGYVDTTVSGIVVVAPSALATAAVLPNTPTYANGAAGVGATLTAGSNTTLTVDGTAAPLNTVVLVKNQASALQNGIYTVTTAGSGGAPWVLTRATYFDQAAEMKAGSYTFITSGATNINSAWVLGTAVATVGTDPANFFLFTSSSFGVASIAGLTGAVGAGTGMAASGATFGLANMAGGTVKCNYTGATAVSRDCLPWTAGIITMYPNPTNNPGSSPNQQIARDGFGAPVTIIGSTTGGLHEVELLSAQQGNPLVITEWGINTNYPGNPNPQYIDIPSRWSTQPRGIWSIEIINTTLNCDMVDSQQCIEFDSAEIGRFTLVGQVVYGGTGAAVDFHPLVPTPNDHFINFSLNDINMITTVATDAADANIRFNLSGAGQNFGVLQNKMTFKEINGGSKGIRVTDSTGVNGGVTNRFNHNIIDVTTVHGQTICGICVGDSTTNQQYLSGNYWTAMFSSSSSTDAFVTYERNSIFNIGINDENSYTNGLHFKTGSINNTAFLLDMGGATNKVVDDNGLGAGGNIVIGNGDMTYQGYSQFGAWKSYTPTVSCQGGGALGAYTSNGRYRVAGKTASINVNVNVSAIGTCAGNIVVPLPNGVVANSVGTPTYVASAINNSGNTSIASLVNGANLFLVFGGGPGANNYISTANFELQ